MELETKRFNAFIRDVMARSDAGASTVLRAFALKLIGRVIKGWPVDTGRSRAAWYVSIEQLGGIALGKDSPEGRAAGRYEEKLRGMNKFILMVNGVEYAVFLEMGHSVQAPYGVVRISMMQMRKALPKEMRDKIREAARIARRTRVGGGKLTARQVRTAVR